MLVGPRLVPVALLDALACARRRRRRAGLVDALVAAAVAAWVVVVVGLARLVVPTCAGAPSASRAARLGGGPGRRPRARASRPSSTHPADAGRSPLERRRDGRGRRRRRRSPRRTATRRRGRPALTTEATIASDRAPGHRARTARGRCRSRPRRADPARHGRAARRRSPQSCGVARAARRRVVARRRGRRRRRDLAPLLRTPRRRRLLAGVAACARRGRPAESTSPTSSLRDGEASLDDGSWHVRPGRRRSARCAASSSSSASEGDGTHVVLVPRGATARARRARRAVARRRRGPGRPRRSASAAPCARRRRPCSRRSHCARTTTLVVCDGEAATCPTHPLAGRCVRVVLDAVAPLADGRALRRRACATAGSSSARRSHRASRRCSTAVHDRPVSTARPRIGAGDDRDALEDRGVVVRLLTAVPRVDGLLEPLEPGRERRAVELARVPRAPRGRARDRRAAPRARARHAVDRRGGQDALQRRVVRCGARSATAPFGPRLPPAGRSATTPSPATSAATWRCSTPRAAGARRCDDAEEQMAWLRAALELVESEPFATVLEGYDWFLTEGHLARLQAACEDAACELVELAARARAHRARAFALERARARRPVRRAARSRGRARRASASGELRGDRARGAQHGPVRTRRHVAVRTAPCRASCHEVVEQLEEARGGGSTNR